jgi:hypothetical protein
MAQPDSSTPIETKIPVTAETVVDEKLNQIANKAALKASKTERKYDEKHDIFTK